MKIYLANPKIRTNIIIKMVGVTLFDYQNDALNKMKNGCILNGTVGSGKSRTSIAYYYILNGGMIYYTKKYDKIGYYYERGTNNIVSKPDYHFMTNPCDLYIITTARKRDTMEWEGELLHFLLSTDPKTNKYKNKVIVDSWNNISKYKKITNAFFIFDEQRVVGYGAWTKSFLEIAKNNQWILLSATPGDTWSDYIPVFIANGFFKNKTDFERKHVIFSRYTKYPKIEGYINQGHLISLRKHILVNMDFDRKTEQHHEYVITDYDRDEYNYITKTRWNIYKEKPIENAGEYCLCLRRLVNSDISRQEAILKILEKHPKAIIFYTYDYELEILKKLLDGYPYTEWNGHKHEPILVGDYWVYLVEYTAGCEGWNCITTDTIIFYSQNYSYKVMQQASGRIDRLNTPYLDLYYYHLRSNSKIDLAIRDALKRKKKFNESAFIKKNFNTDGGSNYGKQ